MKKLIILLFVALSIGCSKDGSSSNEDTLLNDDPNNDNDNEITSNCTDPNFFNYNTTTATDTECSNTVEFVSNLNLIGQPYYILSVEDGVVITGGESSSISLKFDLNSRDVDIFPSTIFNTEFRVFPNLGQVKNLGIAANENRRDEIIKFDYNGVRVYSVSNNAENLETYNFDVTELIPISQVGGHEYRTVNKIYEAFKVNEYLYLFFTYAYNNLNNNTVYYRFFIIRGSEYGAGNWEYLGEYDSNLVENANINDIIVTNQGEVLLIRSSSIMEFDLNTNSFNFINLDPPSEFGQNDGITQSYKGFLGGEYNYNGNKEYVHYAYANIDDNSNAFKFWYYNSSLNSWFETNEILDFGGNAPRMRASSINRTDNGANTLFSVNEEGEMFLFSPH